MYYRHNDAGMYGSWAMGLALGVAEKWFILLSAFIFTVIFLSTSRIGPGIYFSLAFWVGSHVRRAVLPLNTISSL